MPDLLRNLIVEGLKQATKSSLYIVRHGTTQFNESDDERIRAWLNISLDDNGIRKAKEAVRFLKDKNISRLCSSDLERCHQTAKIIAEELDLPIHLDPSLRPWDVGQLTGTPIKDAIPVMMKYVDEPKSTIPGGESYGDFYSRWKNSLEKYIARAAITGDTICLVTHSRNIYCMDNILSNGKSPIIFDGKPEPGGILRVDISSETNIKEVL